MIKKGKLLIAGLALIIASSGCNTKNEVSKEQITVTSGRFEQDLKKLEELKKEYPHITYSSESCSYNSLNIIPMAINEQLPSMFEVPFTEPEKIINSGYAGNVTESIKKYGYDKKIKKKYLDMVTKDGEYYGVPIYVYNMGLMCNIKLFKEAGLVDDEGYPLYPKTYTELAETASLIKQRTGKPGFFFATTQKFGGWYFMNIAWSFGVEFEKEVDGKRVAAFNTPECVEALQYVKDLKWKYDVLQEDIYDDFHDMFPKYNNDGVGMNFFVSSELDRYSASGWNKDNIMICPNPAGPAGRYSLGGGVVFMFNKNITREEADACFLWIDEIYGSNLDKEKAKKELKMRADSGQFIGYANENIWNVPEYNQKLEKINEEYRNVDKRQYEEFAKCEDVTVKTESYTNMQELYNILDIVIQTVLTDEDSDPEALIKDAAEKYQTNYLDIYQNQ